MLSKDVCLQETPLLATYLTFEWFSAHWKFDSHNGHIKLYKNLYIDSSGFNIRHQKLPICMVMTSTDTNYNHCVNLLLPVTVLLQCMGRQRQQGVNHPTWSLQNNECDSTPGCHLKNTFLFDPSGSFQFFKTVHLLQKEPYLMP